MGLKRRTCIEWNNRNKKGPIGCVLGMECKYFCPGYARRVKSAYWKVPVSQCKYLRYRYDTGKSVKKCAKGNIINGYCEEMCKDFRLREKKTPPLV